MSDDQNIRSRGQGFTPWPDQTAERYRQEKIWTGELLGDILDRSTIEYSDDVAIVDGSQTWTYRRLDDRANQLVDILSDLGVGPGDNVVVQFPNVGQFFEVFFALMKLGSCPVLALPTHRLSEISDFCQASESVTYVAANDEAYRRIADALLENGLTDYVLLLGENEQYTSHRSSTAAKARTPPQSSHLALFQLSGGTTSLPKLIPRTHDDYFYSVKASAEVAGLTDKSVYLAVLPVAHNFTLSSPGALGAFLVGGTVVLAKSGAPDEAFPLLDKHGVTIAALVPPLLQVWLRSAQRQSPSAVDTVFSTLEVIQVGGAKLSSDLASQVKPTFGCDLQQVFGMAEGLVCYTRLQDSSDLVTNTQGRPMSPADEIKVVDDDDNPVPPGTPGHLLVRGPYTIRGYHRAPELNRAAFTSDGFYRTGDIVALAESGYLTVEGRAKDQINRGGEKIAASEIEARLRSHEAVADAAVVAMPDPFLGERSCAFIALTDPEKPLSQARNRTASRVIIASLRRQKIADYKIPDRIEIVQELPKTDVGKIDKSNLRRQAATFSDQSAKPAEQKRT